MGIGPPLGLHCLLNLPLFLVIHPHLDHGVPLESPLLPDLLMPSGIHPRSGRPLDVGLGLHLLQGLGRLLMVHQQPCHRPLLQLGLLLLQRMSVNLLLFLRLRPLPGVRLYQMLCPLPAWDRLLMRHKQRDNHVLPRLFLLLRHRVILNLRLHPRLPLGPRLCPLPGMCLPPVLRQHLGVRLLRGPDSLLMLPQQLGHCLLMLRRLLQLHLVLGLRLHLLLQLQGGFLQLHLLLQLHLVLWRHLHVGFCSHTLAAQAGGRLAGARGHSRGLGRPPQNAGTLAQGGSWSHLRW